MQIFRWGRRIWAESKQKASVESTLRLILRNFALHPITPRPKRMSGRILRLSIWNFAFDRLSAPEHSFASLIIFQRLPKIIPSPTNKKVQVLPSWCSHLTSLFFSAIQRRSLRFPLIKDVMSAFGEPAAALCLQILQIFIKRWWWCQGYWWWWSLYIMPTQCMYVCMFVCNVWL